MSSEAVIRLRGVSKCYRVFPRPVDRIRQFLVRGRKLYREVWALRDVDLDVRRGETLGIVGRNGSGKSTLLEIIADTNTPTSGVVEVQGRVAALLELGAGFNPEFTGRENIYTNGAILGIPEARLRQQEASIIEFAELAPYIDQPVKTYSSGMYVRLAFAVAVHLDPDILIVDEALSVGDIRFQRKCFRKFEELKQRGKTIIFVTHATDLVVNQCDRAVFLEGGAIRMEGAPRDTVNAYLDYLFGGGAGALPVPAAPRGQPPADRRVLNRDPALDQCPARRSYNPTEYRWGDGTARIIDYLLVCQGEVDVTQCPQGAPLDLYVSVHFTRPAGSVIYGLTVKTVDGITVYGSNNRLLGQRVLVDRAGEVAVVRFRLTLDLAGGDYFISLGVVRERDAQDHQPLDRRYDLIHLRVEGNGKGFGIADLKLQFDALEDSARLEAGVVP